jgi:hypothetical protein
MTTSPFIRINNKHNDGCPVCGRNDGACRRSSIDEDFILCKTHVDAHKKEIVNGYICVKTSNGHTASFKPVSDTYLPSETFHRVIDTIGVKNICSMPAIERDRHYRDILDQLRLHIDDRTDLVRRGFTNEQIVSGCFKSVERWQKLNKNYPENLPGINKQGNGLISHTPGYVCPISDADGLIVGLQVRKRVLLNGDKQRYYFLSKNSNIRLNDQIPLAIFSPGSRKLNKIALVEGVGAKPFLTCERLGISVIGASGGMHASSEFHLKQALLKLGVVQGEEVTIFPDAGSVRNKDVIHQYKRTVETLTKLGYTPVFAWWGQVNKSKGDIDELQAEQLVTINYLSVAEFYRLCVKWGGLQARNDSPTPTAKCATGMHPRGHFRANFATGIIPGGKIRDFWERVALAQRKLHTLSYPVDLACDPSKKYLPNLVGRIPTSGIVLLKSPKGSGKSHQIKAIKQHCCGRYEEKITCPEVPELTPEQLNLLAINKQPLPTPEPIIEKVWNPGLGMKFVSINARIALGRGQAVIWEFTYIEDADTNVGKEEFGIKLTTETIIENISEIGLCANSLAKLKYRDWSNTLIVIDEIELVLNHVSTSSTCREKRSEILQIIQDKIKEALDNGGLLIGADADITDVTVDYLKGITPNHPAFIVNHDFKGDPWNISFCADKRDQILSQIEEHLADPQCEPIAIAIDSQKEAEALDMVLKRKYPYLENLRGGLIRIDSKITQQDFGKDFVKNPNESISKYLPKILIYSPSLGVGCSIDVKYFKHVYGLFFGNLEPSQARQMLARVREPVPRTVWAKVRAGNADSETTSYLPEDIKKRMFGKNETAMVPIEMALIKAREEVKASGIDDPEDKDILPVLIETLQKMQGEDGSWNNPHVDLYCNQQARRNFALSQLAVQLRQELIDEGHNITDTDGEETTNTAKLVDKGKEEIKRRDSTLTSNAEDIPFKDAQELKRKAARTVEEEHKISKAFLKHDLPELDLTPDFIYKAVHKDNGRWLSQAKLFWLLNNPEALAHKDEKHWKLKLAQFSKGVTCLWDVKADTPKVEAIIKSGVLDWIDLENLDAEYCGNSPEGQKFLAKCLANKKAIRNALGITVKPDSKIIAIADKLLTRLGLGLSYERKSGGVKYYKLNEELATDSDRNAVFEALNLKWQNEVAKMAENQAQQQSQVGTYRNKFLDKNNSKSQIFKPEEFPENHVVSRTTDEWLTQENLANTASQLEDCENIEMLEDVRSFVPVCALKAASKLLPKPKFAQIKEWVLELNSQVLSLLDGPFDPIPGF